MLKLRPYEVEYLQDICDKIERGDDFTISPDEYQLEAKLIVCCISECIYQNKIASEGEED